MRAPPPSARIGATVLERGRRRGATRARGHDGERTSILPDLLIVLGLAAIYFIAGKLGLKLAFVHANATPVWPPTGIAIAASLLLGSRVWPGIFLGAYLVAITTQGSVATSLGIAAGNTLEGVVAGLVNRFARGSSAFDRSQDLLKFVLLAGPLSPIVSATFGVTSLSLGGYASWSQYPSIWFTWWLGDVGGALLVAPLIVIWGRARRRWNRGRLPEAFLALIILVLVGQTVFGGWFPGEVKNYELTYLCLPVLVWMGLRFGLHETALASLLLSQIAIWGTLRGYGPFVRASPNESLLLLQAFMGASAVFALVFRRGGGAARASRRETEKTPAKASNRAGSDRDAGGVLTHLCGLQEDSQRPWGLGAHGALYRAPFGSQVHARHLSPVLGRILPMILFPWIGSPELDGRDGLHHARRGGDSRLTSSALPRRGPVVRQREAYSRIGIHEAFVSPGFAAGERKPGVFDRRSE